MQVSGYLVADNVVFSGQSWTTILAPQGETPLNIELTIQSYA